MNRSLMQRYALIERAKDADIVGLLVGTLAVARYREVLAQLRELVHRLKYQSAHQLRQPLAKLAAEALGDPRFEPVDDWVATAELFRGVPYVWGGRSSGGIDCSGLIQLALQLLVALQRGPVLVAALAAQDQQHTPEAELDHLANPLLGGGGHETEADRQVERVEGAIAALADDERIVLGEFRPDGVQREWCDVNVLRQLRRRSLAVLRKEVEPVEQEAFGRFLPNWHGIPAERRGLDALVDTIGLLAARNAGIEVPDESIDKAEYELFDYQKDPLEKQNIASEQPELFLCFRCNRARKSNSSLPSSA